jgi:phosphatidylglycerol:prolipoprotein diacylglycerol transferase
VPNFLLIPWFKLEPWEIPVPVIHVLKLQPFGLLVAIGILFGSRIAEWRAEKTGVPRYVIADFLVYTIMIGLASAMLLNVAMYEPEKFGQMGRALASYLGSGPSEPFPYPGLSSFGGFFGGTMAALWFRHKKRMSLMVLGDLFCFAFPFAWLFGRSGCFVVHDHPGLPSSFFLAVDNYHLQGIARHDLGLYEVLWSAVMIPLLLWLGSKPRPWGFFMAFVPLAYAPLRFFLDFLREDAEQGGDVRYLGLTPGHYSAVVMTIAGIAVAVRVARGSKVTLLLDGPAPEIAPEVENKPDTKHARTSSKPVSGRKSKAK